MIELYNDRLSAISDMLDNPQIAQEAYDLLLELWLEYFRNARFIADVKKIAASHAELGQELLDRIAELSIADDKKTLLLNNIALLMVTRDSPTPIPEEVNKESQKDRPETKFSFADSIALLIGLATFILTWALQKNSSLGVFFSILLISIPIILVVYVYLRLRRRQ
jgi:hypothetical protein